MKEHHLANKQLQGSITIRAAREPGQFIIRYRVANQAGIYIHTYSDRIEIFSPKGDQTLRI